jgi:16S rRNA (uracil1498-N3)-methyltransferase
MNFFIGNDLKDSQFLEVIDDQVHHFKNVSRGKEGDEVKVFNGKGVVIKGIVRELKKKSLTIEVLSKEESTRKRDLSMILGVPKREYLDSILRSSVQLGLKEVLLIHTRFSPQKYKATPRQDKIIQAAIIQSENPWSPEVKLLNNLSDINDLDGAKLLFSTEVARQMKPIKDTNFRYFIIGPEGGFHKDEVEFFRDSPDIELIHCPTAIMKAETAVSYAAGMLDASCALFHNY